MHDNLQIVMQVNRDAGTCPAEVVLNLSADAANACPLSRSTSYIAASSAAASSSIRETRGHAVSETLPASLRSEECDVFREFNRHLLIVSEAAASLLDARTCADVRSSASAPLAFGEVAVPSRNERWTPATRGLDLPFFFLKIVLLLLVSLGACSGWSLYQYLSKSDELSGGAAVSALVERIVAVESNGDPSAKNSRSSATGIGQFLDETWLDLVRAYRQDLTRGRSAIEILKLRCDPKLAREIITFSVARNIAILRQRRLPVTAGTVYLTHFAGSAGAVAILSAPDNSDAALVIANADSTGRTKREHLVKANSFLRHFTVADLKVWADRKMRGPNLRLVEVADIAP